MMKDSLVLTGISPISTANEILNKLACAGQVGHIDMIFPEIPEKGKWYGEAFLKFNNEDDLSQFSAPYCTIRGVQVKVARANLGACERKSCSESFKSNCSTVNSSFFRKQSDNMLMVDNLKRGTSKAFEIKKYFSWYGRVQSVSLHFDLKLKEGFAVVEFDSVEDKRSAIASYKNPVLCKSRVNIEKLPGDSFDSVANTYSSWNGVSASSDQASVIERHFEFAGGKPVEIRIDLASLPAKNVTFKRSHALGVDDYFVEIDA